MKPFNALPVNKRVITFVLALFTIVAVHAQTPNGTITGKIIGNDSISLIGVAVIMQTIDSIFLDGTTTDVEGNFRLKHPGRSYRLLFQHIAYKPYSIETSNSQLGTIVLLDAVNELKEIAITARRPLVKMEGNRLTYNVGPLMQNRIIGNAFDLLKEIPSIKSDENSLTLNGAIGETHIIINGKPSSLSAEQATEYLKSLPAEQVEKAEIVYNAPPQWHVKGAAINIILKKNDQYKVRGQVQGIWNNKHANNYTGGGSLFVSNKKVSFDLLYNYKNNNELSRSIINSQHTVGDKVYDIESDSREKSKKQSHNIYSSINYNLTDKSSLNLSYNGQIAPDIKTNSFTRNNLFSDASSYDAGNSNLHNIRLTYDAPFGLKIGTEYTHFNNDMKQDMAYQRKEQDNASSFKYNRNQKIAQANFFADMAHALPHDWKLSYGAKYEYTTNNNNQIYNDLQNNGKDDYNRTSKTTEKTAQLYAGISKSFFENKLNIDFSLTGEIYQINDYKKNVLLPNATISYAPSAKHIFQLSYISLRRYPSYWQRQDYVAYNDEYSVSYGNPTLKPDKTSYVTLAYVFNNRYILQASYYKVNDFVLSQSYQASDKLELMQKSFNIDYSTAFTTNLIIPIKVGTAFSSNVTASVSNERYKNSHWFDISYNRSNWNAALMADNTLVVSKKPNITINAMMFYRTPTIQGIWDLSDNWCVNAGTKYSFADGKAIISLQCYDLFESIYPTTKVRYGNQYQNLNDNFYQRSFTLSFTYKFNSYKNKQRKTVDTSRFGTN